MLERVRVEGEQTSLDPGVQYLLPPLREQPGDAERLGGDRFPVVHLGAASGLRRYGLLDSACGVQWCCRGLGKAKALQTAQRGFHALANGGRTGLGPLLNHAVDGVHASLLFYDPSLGCCHVKVEYPPPTRQIPPAIWTLKVCAVVLWGSARSVVNKVGSTRFPGSAFEGRSGGSFSPRREWCSGARSQPDIF